MVYSQTTLRKLSFGNRIAYQYALTDVQDDSTSILRTPFKKIMGYIIEGTTTAGTTIRVVSRNEGSPGNPANLVLDAGTDNDEGQIIVWGLL